MSISILPFLSPESGPIRAALQKLLREFLLLMELEIR